MAAAVEPQRKRAAKAFGLMYKLSAGWSFDNSLVMVPISVGQSCHEGEKFQLLMDELAAKQCRVVVVVADSLQRYTLAMAEVKKIFMSGAAGAAELVQFNPDDFAARYKQQAIKAGDAWIERNKAAIACLGTKLVRVMRWEEWLQQPWVAEKLCNLNAWYQQVPIFKKEDEESTFHHDVDKSLGKFLDRYMQGGGAGFDLASPVAQLVRRYVLEECAVLLGWGEPQALRPNFICYPNRINSAMYNLLRQYHAQAELEPFLNFVRFDFTPIERTLSGGIPATGAAAGDSSAEILRQLFKEQQELKQRMQQEQQRMWQEHQRMRLELREREEKFSERLASQVAEKLAEQLAKRFFYAPPHDGRHEFYGRRTNSDPGAGAAAEQHSVVDANAAPGLSRPQSAPAGAPKHAQAGTVRRHMYVNQFPLPPAVAGPGR